jgi:hypothetical protein
VTTPARRPWRKAAVVAAYFCIIVMIWWLSNLAVGKPQRCPADDVFARLIGCNSSQTKLNPIIMDIGGICVLALLGLPLLAAVLAKGTIVWRSTLVLFGVVIWLFYGIGLFAAAAWSGFVLN